MAEVDPSVLHVNGKGLSIISATIAPISILSDDILLLIFEINSWTITSSDRSGGQRNPLNTARAASQVCQTWRCLLLNSPTIWGRCVNLNVLKDGKSEWREEVLKRTQSSPLWIVGDVPESTSTEDESPMDIRCYFRRLLKLWERIQKLDVVIRGKKISEDIQNAFLSPAPILRQFGVFLPDLNECLFLHSLMPNSTESLFANYAPSMVKMDADMVAFRTDSPWLANLRYVLIPFYVDVPGLLDLLSRTPLLETLLVPLIQETEIFNLVGYKTRISLPHLAVMCLNSTLACCTTIIDHVSPAKDCSFEFSSSDYDPISGQARVVLKERLPTYISNYFTAHPATNICLQIETAKFLFQDVPETSDSRCFFKNTLLFPNSHSASETMVSVIQVIQAFVVANQMSPSLFNTVTKLDIAARDISASIIPELYTMLLPFQSVEHLITNDVSMRYILQLSLQGYHYEAQPVPVLFPKLHTLQMKYLFDDLFDKNNNYCLLHFLEERKNVGLPISKLDLTRCVLYALRDISDLERVRGLEVVWTSGDNTVSYVCGSGKPEKLMFKPPRADDEEE